MQVATGIDDLLCQLLYCQLRAMGCFARLPAGLEEMRSAGGISPIYRRWFEATAAVLVRRRYLFKEGGSFVAGDVPTPEAEESWQSWAEAGAAWAASDSHKALAPFIDIAIRALPEILSRRRAATDVLFPNGSLSLVQGIYKDNPTADYFNEVLANSVEAYVQLRLAEDPAAQIRILEVGAGTGGSTAQILRQLRPYRSSIAEYCYTDISNVFLSYGREEFGGQNPAMTFRILNIDQPLSDQNIASGSFDMAVASNVLHASPNIRRTLLNIKSGLMRNGVVVFNELSANSLLAHLTFGLLEGWWLYEDPEIRIPGCPALTPESWKQALEEAGFRSVFFPAAEAHQEGQQIVIAESDGQIQVVPRIERQSVNGHGRASVHVQGRGADDVRLIVRARLAAALKIDERDIDDNETFSNYGVDSINGVNIVNAINEALGIALQTIVLFDYSSVNALTDYISQQHGDSIVCSRGVAEDCDPGAVQESSAPLTPEFRVSAERKDSIAVIGMSGRFGSADSVTELWQHLIAGSDLVVDATRWDLARHYRERFGSGGNYCTQGSFLQGIDLFDASFFQISAVEARLMDPQQRLFLEECWKALEDAGYAGDTRYHERCGIYAGCAGGDYQRLFSGTEPGQAFWGNAGSILPARIAYFLNLRGAAIALDTACSSSLVAIHLACQSLWRGETDMVLAGGAHVQSTPTFYMLSSGGGMLSPTGRCHTFGDQADGFVPGEGVGVVVLKRLSDAIADRDHIYGVIRGSGINQDGATNGITAPSSRSQERLECEVYDRFHINPESIQMVEAHGTGTRLGDPIEFEALSRAFRRYTSKKGYCAIGSIKTNIGHTATAAGVAGVIKVLLSLQNATIPASLHCAKHNPGIAIEGSPFYVNVQTKRWDTAGERHRAAVSSFGFGGTNAHMVIEEAPPSAATPKGTKPAYWFVLSARSAVELRRHAEQLRGFIGRASGDGMELHCGDISYSLLVGRRHFNHRLSCLVRDSRELESALGKWLDTASAAQIMVSEVRDQKRRQQPELIRYGNRCLQECGDGLERSTYLEKLGAAAELYLQGYALDFELLFARDRFRRIPLPTYPFARTSYWISSAVRIHPLLHEEVPDTIPGRRRYSSTFTGAEWFFADHLVQGEKILPAAAQIEMARVAAANALGLDSSARIRLQDIVWSRPVRAKDSQQSVQIRILEDSRYEVFSGSQENIHGQGRVALGRDEADRRIDLSSIRDACQSHIVTGEKLYEQFRQIGIEYGPAFQTIDCIYTGVSQVLARIHLPSGLAETSKYVLHPSLIDAALQGTLPLFADGGPIRPALPFALRTLEMFRSCPETAWVWIQAAAPRNGTTREFDLDISDGEGRVCVALRGFSTRSVPTEVAPERDTLLLPVWDSVPIARGPASPTTDQRILLIDVDGFFAGGGWTSSYPRLNRLDIEPHAGIEELAGTLGEIGTVEHVMWIAPESSHGLSDIEAAQDRGVRSFFRLIKALIQTGYGAASLSWTVITCQCQSIRRTDRVDPTHSAVHGLAGSMTKEYPNWRVRLIDVPSGDDSPPMDEIVTLPYDSFGNSLVYRDRQWYQQRLVELSADSARGAFDSRYRHGGLYVVLGGAGGVGAVWSEYMIRRYQAQIVWFGRRAENDAIRAKADALGSLGPKPEYFPVDATDLPSLQIAALEIKRRFGTVHGVVHSAIVLLDQGLATMSEDRFNASLSAKLNTSVNLARVFADEPLDFFLFFSSMNSFVKAAGQSNYAAGCTFEDAFALHLAQTRSATTRVMHWGYWGDVGVVSAPEYRQRMERAGIASIQPASAMEALELLLSGPMNQLGLGRTTRPLSLPILLTTETATLTAGRVPDYRPSRRDDSKAVSAVAEIIQSLPEVDAALAGLLFAGLRSLGFFESDECSISAQKMACGLMPQYDRWLMESLRALARRQYIAIAGDIARRLFDGVADPWIVWKEKRAEWSIDPILQAMAPLAEETLTALPGILTGKRLATDILFPRGSMKLVAALYQNNPVADYFNNALADAVAEFVKASKSPQIRILEIGAGTGSATVAILRKLRDQQDRILEYYYTDLSKSFIGLAQRTLGPEYLFIHFGVLDITQPLASNKLAPGEYDLVVASNVLHATPNVRQSVRNAKAALRAGGALIFDELSAHTMFAHLTFGLCDGWWLYEDDALRIPGGPAAAPGTWQALLQDEGFLSVSLLTPDATSLGQQILFGISDGIARQRLTAPLPTREVRKPVDKPHRPAPGGSVALEEVRSIVRECLAESLGLQANEIEFGANFREYGLDSIIAVQMVNLLGQRLGLTLETTLLFDHDTIDALAAYLVGQHGATRVAATPIPSETVQLPTTYQRVLLERPGQIDGIKVVSSACRALAGREIRVAVKAFSLNFADLLCVKGLYPTMPPYPFTPGFEASGVVVELGKDVRSVKVGDAVIAGAGESLGGHASMWICLEEQVFLKPEALSFEGACALPAVSLTMIDVFRRTKPRRGERILIQTATGGTGLIAVQMAQRIGLEILATAGSQSKLDYLAGLGVPHCINYRERDFETEVMRITRQEGVDIVINALPGDAMQKGLRCLRSGGRYVEIAMTALKSAKHVDLSVLNDNQSFFSLDLRKLARGNAELMKEYQQEFVRLVDAGSLQPVIHEVFPLDRVKDAYSALENRSHIGKVVVRVPEEAPAAPRFPELVRLNSALHGRPVFWFHGGVGGVEMYQPLALAVPRPFYGIQARGWMSDLAPIRGLRAMARYYCEIIRSVQPEGPYDLGGYSMGGMLAYEVARYLQLEMQSIGSIVMLDSPDSTHLDVFRFSKQTAILQAVNSALFSKVAGEPDRLRSILIDRAEVDGTLADEALLQKLVAIAQTRGISKGESQLRAAIEQSARLHDSYELEEYAVEPLPDPQSVTCFYFRNGSRRFWGDMKSFLTMTADEVHLDGARYWEEWERHVPKLQIVDVSSSSHLTLLVEPKPFEEISSFCAKLYATGA